MRKYLSLLSFVFVFVLAGCSGNSKESQQNNTAETGNEMNQESMSTQNNSDSQAQTVDIYGIDNMKYVVKEKKDFLKTGQEMTVKGDTYYLLNGITANAGQNLTINLHTISSLPPSAMSHNWCLIKQGTDAEAFANAGASAKENDYIASDMENKVIKETGLVGGGESKSITLTVPQQTGDYTYLCTFPGHYTSGMKGTLTVQ